MKTICFFGGIIPAVFQQFIQFSTSPIFCIFLLTIQIISVIKYYQIIKKEKDDY